MSSRGTPSRSSALAFGFLGGLFALVAGAAVTALAASTDENRTRIAELVSSEGPSGISLSQLLPEWYHVLGWEFLAAHQVTITARDGDLFDSGQWLGEYVQTLFPASTELQAVPPLLLVTAGFLVAFRQSRARPADAALSGASVVIGYLPGIVVLAFVTTFEVVILGDVVLTEVGPALGQAVLVAGVAYPVLFGGLGGVLAFALARS